MIGHEGKCLDRVVFAAYMNTFPENSHNGVRALIFEPMRTAGVLVCGRKTLSSRKDAIGGYVRPVVIPLIS